MSKRTKIVMASLSAAMIAIGAAYLRHWTGAGWGSVALYFGIMAVAAPLIWWAATRTYENARRCELCGAPRDPDRDGEWAVKYGILACGRCGPKLKERFGEPDPVIPKFD